MRWMLAPLLAAIALPLLGMAAAEEAPIALHKTTADYRLELDIGPPAHMYSPEQAARLKPTSGEIMVSGHMVAMTKGAMGGGGDMQSASPASPAWRHLELHVWSKANGDVVKNAKVTIRVSDLGTGKTETLPISVMYGIDAGESDWHYGNNVMMPPGHWQVSTTVNGESASFDVTMP